MLAIVLLCRFVGACMCPQMCCRVSWYILVCACFVSFSLLTIQNTTYKLKSVAILEPYACFLVMSLCTGHLFPLLCGRNFLVVPAASSFSPFVSSVPPPHPLHCLATCVQPLGRCRLGQTEIGQKLSKVCKQAASNIPTFQYIVYQCNSCKPYVTYSHSLQHPCGIGSSGVVVRSVNTIDGSTIALKIIPVNLSIEDCTSGTQFTCFTGK
jgi:hypothetical protein